MFLRIKHGFYVKVHTFDNGTNEVTWLPNSEIKN